MRTQTNIRPVVFALLVVSAVLAQESTGSISGTVTDPSGAVVPQVQITITNIQTGVVRKEISTAADCLLQQTLQSAITH